MKTSLKNWEEAKTNISIKPCNAKDKPVKVRRRKKLY